MKTTLLRILFLVAALYDGVLGLAFLWAPLKIFARFGVPPPNHLGYIQFPALLLLVFAAMFLSIAADPAGRRELILYGCGLKFSFCAVTFAYMLTEGIPSMWKPWAWVDLVFLALFIWAWEAVDKLLDGPAQGACEPQTRNEEEAMPQRIVVDE